MGEGCGGVGSIGGMVILGRYRSPTRNGPQPKPEAVRVETTITLAQPALVTASGFAFIGTGFVNLGVALALTLGAL